MPGWPCHAESMHNIQINPRQTRRARALSQLLSMSLCRHLKPSNASASLWVIFPRVEKILCILWNFLHTLHWEAKLRIAIFALLSLGYTEALGKFCPMSGLLRRHHVHTTVDIEQMSLPFAGVSLEENVFLKPACGRKVKPDWLQNLRTLAKT